MRIIAKPHRILIVILCCLPAACSRVPGDQPETAPVHGTVSYQGRPVSGASVRFISDDAPRFATAVTDDQGRFELTTFDEADGAVPGRHVVTVTKLNAQQPVEEGIRDEAAYRRSQEATEKARQQGSAIPARYADPQTSDLTFEVQPGKNVLDIKLVD